MLENQHLYIYYIGPTAYVRQLKVLAGTLIGYRSRSSFAGGEQHITKGQENVYYIYYIGYRSKKDMSTYLFTLNYRRSSRLPRDTSFSYSTCSSRTPLGQVLKHKVVGPDQGVLESSLHGTLIG